MSEELPIKQGVSVYLIPRNQREWLNHTL